MLEFDSDDGESLLVLVGGYYAAMYECREPCRTSRLTGAVYMQALLDPVANPTRIWEVFGMELHVLKALCEQMSKYDLLKDSKVVSVEEQLAIFLYTCRSSFHVWSGAVGTWRSGSHPNPLVFDRRCFTNFQSAFNRSKNQFECLTVLIWTGTDLL